MWQDNSNNNSSNSNNSKRIRYQNQDSFEKQSSSSTNSILSSMPVVQHQSMPYEPNSSSFGRANLDPSNNNMGIGAHDGFSSSAEHSSLSSSNNIFLNFFGQLFPTNSRKTLMTFIYCICFWNFGICVAIFGPTLLDLACQTSSTLSAMSLLYFLQNFTSLIGCFASGLILKNKWISISNFLLVCTILLPISVALMPFAKGLFFLGLIMAFLGFNMGCIDNIANLAILKLHSNNVSPFIQTMHFFYGVGAFLTPIIVKSFLNSNFDIRITSTSLNCYNIEDVLENKPAYFLPKTKQELSGGMGLEFPSLNKTLNGLASLLPSSTAARFTSKTKYAFWILAAIQLPAPLILFLVKFTSNRFNSYVDVQSSDEDQQSQQQQLPTNVPKDDLNEPAPSFSFSITYFKSIFSNIPVFQMTVLVSLLVFVFEGLQASHGGYIFSYAVEKYDIKQTKFIIFKNNTKDKMIINRHHNQNNDDAYLTATFWAFFSIGRLISIFVATKFSSSFMILIDIIGCFISACLLLVSSFFSMMSILYLATCLLGLFLSNTTPTSYSLAEIHIGMTPVLTSFIIICAASGEMILPLIVANLFESVGPNSLLVIEFILTIVASITFARFFYYGREHAKCFDSRDSFIWIKTQSNQPTQNEGSTLVGKSSVKYYSKMDEDSD